MIFSLIMSSSLLICWTGTTIDELNNNQTLIVTLSSSSTKLIQYPFKVLWKFKQNKLIPF